jgi:hypothetical protein
MKRNIILLFIALIVYSCANDKKEKPAVIKTDIEYDPSLITDSSWGAITKKSDYAALQKIFGTANVKDERICGPECIDSIDVSILYPNTKNEAIIYWQDSLYHKKIGMIECYSDSANYHTSSGLKINTGITELLKLNAQKINFYGFGWDYGGSIISYNGGTLEKSPVHFGLDIRYDESNTDNQLMGDIELNTDMPAVKKIIDKIIIRSISLSFHTNNEY